MKPNRWKMHSVLGILLVAFSVRAENAANHESPKSELPSEQQLNGEWNKLTLRQKATVVRIHQALSAMPDPDRKFIHDRIERFMNMTPEQKKQLRENAELWKKMTPEQRERARQEYRLRRQQFEEKWKKEHPGEPVPPFPFGRHKRPLTGESADAVPNVNPQPNKPKGD